MEQERQAYRPAQEFREIRCHGGNFADAPHRIDHWNGEILTTGLGEIPAGDDSEFGRKRLEQHGNDVGNQHNPEERIAVLRTCLKVRGKVAGVHVGNRCHDGWAGK